MTRLHTSMLLCSIVLATACGVEPTSDEQDPAQNEPETRALDPGLMAPPDQGIDASPAADMARPADQGVLDEQDMSTPDMSGVDMREDDMPPTMPAGCGGDPACVDTFPHTISDTTVGGTTRWASYGCAPDTDESGPERVYRVHLTEPGFLSAQLDDGPGGVDVDVHVLVDQDADTCLDRGHLATGALLEPGDYWVVADTWVDDQGVAYPGDFSLTFNLTRPQDLEARGMRPEVAADALEAFGRAWANQQTRRLEYAVTDFSIYSSQPRAWVMDLARGELLFLLTIGHGIGSVQGDDRGEATLFSNTPASYMSSLGMMRAAETYVGDFGYSMRLDGLEPGFNDKARPRDIVVHPDERNRPEVTAQQGWLTPSRGCPTLDPATSRQVVDTLSDGALMFFWYPDDTWRSGSALLD